MQMKKRILLKACLWAMTAFTLLLPAASFAQSAPSPSPPLEVIEAARDGLPRFLRAIPPSDLARFNFSTAKEQQEAVLGAAVHLHTIPAHDILGYDGQQAVSELIVPLNIWLFPVISDGQTRTFLTVQRINGDWQAASIGSSGLAAQWADVQSAYPEQSGYHATLVRVFQATSDFVLLEQPQKKEAGLIALQSASAVLGLRDSVMHDPAHVVRAMQEPVRRNIEMDKAHP